MSKWAMRFLEGIAFFIIGIIFIISFPLWLPYVVGRNLYNDWR